MAGRTAYPPAANRPPRACPCNLAPVRRHGRPSSGLGHRPAGTALKTYEKGNPPYCYRCLPDAGRPCRRTCGASSTSACLQDGGRVESPPDKKLLSSSATYGVRSADAMTVAAVRCLSGDLCTRTAWIQAAHHSTACGLKLWKRGYPCSHSPLCTAPDTDNGPLPAGNGPLLITAAHQPYTTVCQADGPKCPPDRGLLREGKRALPQSSLPQKIARYFWHCGQNTVARPAMRPFSSSVPHRRQSCPPRP